ncbi:kinesin-like protein KIN-8A [Triticum aestivum]|uniref:kinesin-like protein KIN-8A n=1 Tax=Triticum aestivum TaxID=4565 RepID=UPI001D0125B3|nr:kinesin-like protein KIN-8A [Triticum aestivum]
MPVSTRSQASAIKGGDPGARQWSSSAARVPISAPGRDAAGRRASLLPNTHHGLKEKMRALNLFYEQHKQMLASSQGGAAMRRSRTIPHANVGEDRDENAQEEEEEEGEGAKRHHDAFAPLREAAVLRENMGPPEARAPSKNDKVVVFSRPPEPKEKENVALAANVMSCPVKKAAPALPALQARKLSLGGGIGGKIKAIGEMGAANADATGSRIMVFVRLRPMSRKEKEAGSKTCVKIVNKKDVYLTELASENDYLRLKRVRGRHFCFDASFPDSTAQAEVYSTSTADLVEGVLQGRNGTVFCYGATGAGKTYTMLGTMDNPGVMVLAIKDLFLKVRQRSYDGNHSIQLSYLEVYNETVRDLLSPGRPLLLREDKQQGTVAAGLTQYRAYSTDEVMKLLQQGNQNRTTEPTRVNETSSRSHAILQVVVEYRYMDGTSVVTRVGKLSLIDLAGSERAIATDQRSQRSLEGANINRSLLALSSCINALVEGKRHVPYRNSKLTQLLKDSLGGSCNTVMIANISPSNLSFGETQNTLHWADRAKEIKTKPLTAGNEEVFKAPDSDTDQAKLVLELQKENSELRQQVVKQQQKLLTVQAQSLAPNGSPQQCAPPSPHITTTPCSTQRKVKRSILDRSCFSTPNSKRPADNTMVRDLQRKVKTLVSEMEKMKKEHFLQLKQRDEFIRGLINRKNSNDPEPATAERRVITRASLRKAEKDAGELKSPSHRFTSPMPTAKKRTFWDFGGESPSVLAGNGRKTRSHVAAETPTRAPSMLLQPGFTRQRA